MQGEKQNPHWILPRINSYLRKIAKEPEISYFIKKFVADIIPDLYGKKWCKRMNHCSHAYIILLKNDTNFVNFSDNLNKDGKCYEYLDILRINHIDCSLYMNVNVFYHAISSFLKLHPANRIRLLFLLFFFHITI